MNNFRFPAILFIVGTLVVVLGAFLKIIGNGGVLSQSLLIVGMTATAVSIIVKTKSTKKKNEKYKKILFVFSLT